MPVVVGAVLAGGASRRMGRDKALVEVAGSPMIVRVAEALRAGGCTTVTAVGGDVAAFEQLGLSTLPDGHPGEGPLGGILTALRSRPAADAVVVVSCDVPSLDGATVSALIAALLGGPAQVAMATSDRLQPLCAAWRPSSEPVLAAAFAGGERAVRLALDGLAVIEVPVAEAITRNVNTPNDLDG